jgi:glycosyltransferase involved in cell wall biosynthesis
MSSVATPHRTGVATYIVELVTHLAAADSTNRYYLCYRLSRMKRRAHFLKLDQNNFRTKMFQEPFAPILSRKLDVFHGPDARLPQFSGVPLIATVFDLFSLVSTEFASEEFRTMKRRRYQDIAERTAHIITISESTKRDIVERLGIAAHRITCIYPSVSRAYRPRALDECLSIRKKYGINTEYLVCVGNISRRKNVLRLLEAFAQLPGSLLTTTTLVLAGRETYGEESVRDQIRSLSLGDTVVVTGYVPQEDLPTLVAGARAMVLVSLYEGFGFPVLEAMASGVPVITSNVSSLPEVAGDAALLVDPHDATAISSAIERIMTDETLREELRRKGLARASQFSWDEATAQTLALYRRVADRGH